MIIIMNPGASEEQINFVAEKLKGRGFGVHFSRGVERTVIGAIGDKSAIQIEAIEALPGVSEIVPIRKPYKLVSREFQKEDSQIKITKKISIGSRHPICIIAGPCSVESKEQILDTAISIKNSGARALRGGAFKPRTSPYSFQGMGEKGLKCLEAAYRKTGLPIVTELMDIRHTRLVAKYAHVIQIGARNIQNFPLLKEVGKLKKPVLLKRGAGSTIEELLMSAEYILSEGNHNVILCERGIRTYENYTRNTLDLNAVPVIKKLSHLPVVVDPSHGTGKWDLVEAMSKAAIACGADGLLVEVHPHPEDAVSDGQQSLRPETFEKMMRELKVIAAAVGRSI
ncbi:3-deoxy-7-phosphoheptulonate synthase [Candidatus Margulisiibacteriota bacterium]